MSNLRAAPAWANQLLELMDEIEEYLEEHADADGRSDGSFIPNDAMRLLIQVKYAVALLKQEKAA